MYRTKFTGQNIPDEIYRSKYKLVDRFADRETYRWTDREADRQVGRENQTGRQRGKQSDTYIQVDRRLTG